MLIRILVRINLNCTLPELACVCAIVGLMMLLTALVICALRR